MPMKMLVMAVAISFAFPAFAGPAEDKALIDAALDLKPAAVAAALKAGANPNAASVHARPTTALVAATIGTAVNRGVKTESDLSFEIIQALFAAGATLGRHDLGILYFPISNGNERLISLLLDKGASPTRKISGFTPTEIARRYGHDDAYELLVDRGGIPVDAGTAAQLAFVAASGRRSIADMKSALSRGATMDGKDTTGQTGLIAALRYRLLNRSEAEAIWWMLDNGADTNRTGESGFDGQFDGLTGIPLHLIVYRNKHMTSGSKSWPGAKELAEETMIRLLKAGAKVSGMDAEERTALHFAAKADNVRAAEILIAEGARVMARDKRGKSPLDYAESGAMIKLLKANGAVER